MQPVSLIYTCQENKLLISKTNCFLIHNIIIDNDNETSKKEGEITSEVDEHSLEVVYSFEEHMKKDIKF